MGGREVPLHPPPVAGGGGDGEGGGAGPRDPGPGQDPGHSPTSGSGDQTSAILANLSASYNAVSVSLALPVLRGAFAYGGGSSPSSFSAAASAEEDGMVASSVLLGMVAGQVLGGAGADVMGRIPALRVAVGLQILGSIGSSLVGLGGDGAGGGTAAPPAELFVALAAWRLVLGMGAGAVYPIAAVISAEAAAGAGPSEAEWAPEDAESGQDAEVEDSEDGGVDDGDDPDVPSAERARRVAKTFSAQGVGFVLAPLLAYPLLLWSGPARLGLVWRTLLAAGAIPGLILLLMMRRPGRRGERRPRWRPFRCGRWALWGRGGEGGMAAVPLSDPSERDGRQGETEGEVDGMTEGGDCVDPARPCGEDCVSDDGGDGDDGGRSVPLVCPSAPLHRGPRLRPDGTSSVSSSSSSSSSVQTGVGIWEAARAEPDLVRKLCGTAGTWFLFDILFYGNTLFQPLVLETAFGTDGDSDGGGGGDDDGGSDGGFSLLLQTARDSLFLSAIALPGYFVSVALMGRTTCSGLVVQTPRYVQMQGFALMAALYALIGGLWDRLAASQYLLVPLYGLTFFFANYGPNATTFLLPSVTYGKGCRSTLNGMSAAAGKAGALVGAAAFEPAADYLGDGAVMQMCACVSLLALLVTRRCVRDGDGTVAASS